jgi:uncharacterized FAD-dependent dehydrogenase
MREVTLTLPVEVAYSDDLLRAALAAEAGVSAEGWSGYSLVKRSIDARRRPILGRVVARLYESEEEARAHGPAPSPRREVGEGAPSLLIVGAGPAGLFAALRALSLGVRPVIVERGRAVRDRRRDLAQLNRTGEVNPDSNYCFGEGGAGTYSDGKLYTRAKKRGPVALVFRLLAEHGAPPEVCFEAHPHIGTNRLPKVIESIREGIRAQGGEVRFEARVVGLVWEGSGGERRVVGVRLASGEEVRASEGVVLATGHSARDVFELLRDEGVRVEAKPFALGVRAEHPQELIDQIQYHGARPEVVGSASYRLVTQAEGRGVFSFCMCPGGIIAPAATAPLEVVVNGWSPYKRNGRFANSGVVVSVEEADFAPYASEGPLAALAFQRAVERRAYEVAQGGARSEGEARSLVAAPAQRVKDFLKRRPSASLPSCSYVPGLVSAPLDEVLPPQVARRLRAGLKDFGEKMRGYLSDEALIVGVESRTSSPVRVPRDPLTLEHPEARGLYPCGEGPGYAGGIASAAVDGLRCAEQACRRVAVGDAWAPLLFNAGAAGASLMEDDDD